MPAKRHWRETRLKRLHLDAAVFFFAAGANFFLVTPVGPAAAANDVQGRQMTGHIAER